MTTKFHDHFGSSFQVRTTMPMWIFLAAYGSASLLTDSASSLDLKDRPVTKVIKMFQP